MDEYIPQLTLTPDLSAQAQPEVKRKKTSSPRRRPRLRPGRTFPPSPPPSSRPC